MRPARAAQKLIAAEPEMMIFTLSTPVSLSDLATFYRIAPRLCRYSKASAAWFSRKRLKALDVAIVNIGLSPHHLLVRLMVTKANRLQLQ